MSYQSSRIERDRENPPHDELIRLLVEVLKAPEDEPFAAARHVPPGCMFESARCVRSTVACRADAEA